MNTDPAAQPPAADPPGAAPDPAAAAAAVERLQDQVDALEADLTALTQQVEALVNPNAGAGPADPAAEDTQKPPAAAAAKPPVQVAWWWPGLDDVAAAAAWARLGAWVQHGLLARHPHYGKTLLPCWRRHTAIVDELSALRAVWHAAYTGPAPDPGAAADYLARTLPDTMTRIEKAFSRSGCSTAAGKDHHKDNDEKFQRTQWGQPEVDAFLAARAGSPPGPAPYTM